ncbi:hypothetical protein [Vibrio lentus]|uniref:hypothetical protein n=1 Tax=Vibrio lentus TaxID=136468 RepID=UPI00178CD09C|nr:hypothetical protein [Vibrio lentus]MDN3628200.1 hypothetical protein [Vibrio lentus]
MNIMLGGNPLSVNDDNTVIYTQNNFMPPLTPIESFPRVQKSEVNSFIENLYFITMENNGFSYFYPNLEAGINLCRFEWHFEYNNNPYEIRVGLSFKVENGVFSDVGYYIIPHEYYEDLDNNNNSYEIEDLAYQDMIESVNERINKAITRTRSSPESIFNVLYYVKLSNPVSCVVNLNNGITLLPSRFVHGQLVSAVLIRQTGYSYLSAKRLSDEKVNLLCALFSLSFHKASIAAIDNLPEFIEPIQVEFEVTDELIEKFYPNSQLPQLNNNALSNDDLCIIEQLYELFSNQFTGKIRRKMVNILFSFYSALETELVNQTVGLVSYVACLDAIAKERFSQYRDEHGSRKALVYLIEQEIPNMGEVSTIEKWSKRIYNDHRSSYVHGANIRFEAYSQNLDGKNFAGLPKALPTESKPTSKQYEYNSDFAILKRVTQEMLLRFIEFYMGSALPEMKYRTEISFSVASVPEAHLGMPNKGWVRLTGKQA